ncbi:MAG: hypothetical protein P8K12_07090 [Polaribacter sp.]|nr:hypothetical protein [Polaribacter sp.]
MENKLDKEINQTLLLEKKVFMTLLNSIISQFKSTHLSHKFKDSQLYGFGNYDLNKPNLKHEFEALLKGYVNGKYLYNKYREACSGMPIIKISREYQSLFFKYLDYKNIFEFIESDLFTLEEKNKQLELLTNIETIDDHYYICYYFGEDNKMIKGQVILYNGWKTIEIKYFYNQNNEDNMVYSFNGTVNHSEDFVHFDTKYFDGSKKNEGAKFIFFIGKSSPNERQYLIGTYSGFDKYDRAIAGKTILEKFNSKAEIDAKVIDPFFDPIICQELNKNRIVVESNIRKNPLMFSKKSPYSEILLKSYGNYFLSFEIGENVFELKVKIEKYHFNIVSLNNYIMVEDDKISLINKGQILNFDFSISGMFHLQKVSIYLNIFDFTNHKRESRSDFIGVDINNNIVSGKLLIKDLD